MLLHEFMSAHRSEILHACEFKGAEAHLADYASDFFDETLRAIRRDSGVPESRSPLPASSEIAAQFGAARQRAGVPITEVPKIFAAISQAVGATGEKYDLKISAEEYKLLNGCLDTGVATSLENFWRNDRDRQNQQLTERVGFMAHELRNALSNAQIAFKLLRGGTLGINGKTGDVLARNLVLMEHLVGQWLASVQLEVGVTPALARVHVASVLRNLEASAIPDRGISIQLQLDEQLFISADELLLTSAIGNLVHNAVKFSPPGAVVQLMAEVSDATACIAVQDQCGGLPHDDPARLFEPYVKTREGNPAGTGLGLSIAKRAVESMHGELTVTNLPAVGCVFTARFPITSKRASSDP